MDLKGKRLLILGGTYNTKDIREYADTNGVILIAAGNNKRHPLALIADEFYEADVYNSGDIVKLIKDHRIDGVFSGGNEDIITKMFEVKENIGIPFYASKEQWDITGNKHELKQQFIRAGLPVVPEFVLSTSPTEEELSKISYPVVVKPVDGSGSRGVYLCQNEEELLANIPNSLANSRMKKVIVEKFMRGFITVFYITAINGEYYPASMCDKYAPLGNKGDIMPTIAQLYLYPSRHLDYCLNNYFPSMKRLLINLGIKDGVVGIQGFCDGEKIAFTEIGYRLGGTSQQNYTKALYNYSNMYLLMNYALTGVMTDTPCKENPYFPKTCGTLQLIAKGGKIAEVNGLDEVERMTEVISFEKHYSPGDEIPNVDNVARVMYRIFLVTDNIIHLKNTIQRIQNAISVKDEAGNSLLEDDFDVNRLDFDCGAYLHS